MHKSPDEVEKYLYLDQNKVFLYLFGIFSFVCLSAGMFYFSIQHPALFIFLLFFVSQIFYISISYLVGIFGKPFNLNSHEFLSIRHRKFSPSVDIYLPCAGEPLDVLENTYQHVYALNYQNKIVYVLDDSHSDDVKRLAEKYSFQYIRRPNPGENKKAGNLRYAFTKTSGEFIAIFDADFAARPDFFQETIFYFEHDPKIAIVQTPQFFSIEPDQTWVQKGSAFVQELFYRLIQVNRNTYGASICVGTNAIYRRKALEPMGGTALINYSEDLHTGFNCMELGYKVRYIPLNLTKGICPDTVSAFFSQQYRWAMGSITLFSNPRFWKLKMPVMIRLSYMSGMMYYIMTGIGIFISPLPGLVMIWFFPEQVFWYNILFSVPSLIFGTVYLAKWAKLPFGFYYLQTRALSYYAHLFAVIDKTRGDLMEWIPSGSTGHSSSRFFNFRRLLFAWAQIVVLLATAGAAFRAQTIGVCNVLPFLLFQFFNFYVQSSILRDQ